MTFYPDGYGERMITLETMIAKYSPKMHPEFARRFFAWIESMDGLLGVGGAWRSTQPDLPGFAPDGKSFHQDQAFASGFVGYAAVDLVARNPGHVHRAPVWAESETAPSYGLHTFVQNEPWHIQPIEIRGWSSWVLSGRNDPGHFVLPSEEVKPPPIWGDEMKEVIYKPPPEMTGNPPWLYQAGGSITYLTSWMYTAARQSGAPEVVLNSEQYPLALKAAGLSDA